jgi:hypothetical protein
MPCFHTHVLYGGAYARDLEGEWFADLEAACQRARGGARRLLCEMIAAGHDAIRLEYRIHDAAGTLLATIPVRASVSWSD